MAGAEALYRQILLVRPDHVQAQSNLGLIMADQGRLDEAVAHYRCALVLKPDYAEAHNNLGNALKAQGKLDEAVSAFQRALALKPNFAEAHNNLGNAFQAQGKLDEAVSVYQRALALKPDYADAHNNLGNALRYLGQFEAAAEALQRALRLSPDSPEYLYNLGLLLLDMGRTDQALAAFDQLLAAKPDHVECHWDRALTHLRRGDYERGFAEYEWRWKLKRSPPRAIAKPLWDGKPFANKTLFVHWEQGYGDTLQFVRFLPLVKKLGGAVILECQSDLTRLLASADGGDKLVGAGDTLPDFDCHIPLLSLPWLLKITPATVPAKVPYLAVPPIDAKRIPTLEPGALKVAIAWAGNSDNPEERRRTCPFARFLDLARIPGVALYSIQHGRAAEELPAALNGPLILDVGRTCVDFAETAAVLARMDLVISVDTSIPHLAGALGKPVWTLLSAVCDWRWMDEGERTPWYPTMRLFRQKTLGDWDGVFADVRAELAKAAAENR